MRPTSAAMLLTAAALRPLPRAHTIASVDNMDAIKDSLPFLDASLIAEDVRYTGLGITLSGREACAGAASRWKSSLQTRLKDFAVEDVIVLPPDGRRVVSCRYHRVPRPNRPHTYDLLVIRSKRASIRRMPAPLPSAGLSPALATPSQGSAIRARFAVCWRGG